MLTLKSEANQYACNAFPSFNSSTGGLKIFIKIFVSFSNAGYVFFWFSANRQAFEISPN